MHPLRTAALLLLLGSAASAADTFTQSPVVAPSVERGSAAPPPAAPDASWQTRFLAGPTPLWIWGKDDNTPYILRKEFAAPGVTAAKLRVTCDNWVRLTLNGKQVVDSDKWEEPVEADVTKLLKPEGNVLVAEVRNDGGPAGFVMKLVMTAKGEAKYVVSDTTWTAAEANAAAGAPASRRGWSGSRRSSARPAAPERRGSCGPTAACTSAATAAPAAASTASAARRATTRSTRW